MLRQSTNPCDLQNLLSGMLRIRMVEERIAQEYPKQQMRCPVHLSIGQEATPIGICSLISKSDYAMSTHRSHAHYLAKGGSLPKMIAEIYGKYTGCCQGKGGSMHLIDLSCGFLGATPIVGSTIPIAVGAALASSMNKDGKVTVIFFGEGASEEGAFHEALNFASLKKLPVVFVCENNLYSVYSPVEVRQPNNRSLIKIAEAHGVWAQAADGNDILAVREAGEIAIKQARSGSGPALLEFSTYRWLEHCGPGYDNTLGYRTTEEFEIWKEKCPVSRLIKQLGSDCSTETASIIENTIKKEIDAAFLAAEAAPFPPQETLDTQVYKECL